MQGSICKTYWIKLRILNMTPKWILRKPFKRLLSELNQKHRQIVCFCFKEFDVDAYLVVHFKDQTETIFFENRPK